MRLTFVLPFVAIASLAAPACVGGEDGEDLGTVTDGKDDAPAIDNVAVTLPKKSSTGSPGVRNFYVTSSVGFRVTLTYPEANKTAIVVTNQDDNTKTASEQLVQPVLTVGVSGEHRFKIRLENWGSTTTHARLSVLPAGAQVSPELLAAARANLDRITKEIDYTHLRNYGLGGTNTDQFLAALKVEYADQHPDQYAARVRALASMVFFSLPDVAPPADGLVTPFHGLDDTQFAALYNFEDNVFSSLVSENGGNTAGVR